MRTLVLSGWGQPHDALNSALPDATHFAYAHYDSTKVAMAAIAESASEHDCVVGWSLGGQLAVRAISEGLMQPKKLVLIGVPFQFVKSEELPLGMPPLVYQTFCDNYASNPKRTLRKAWDLISYGDQREQDVKQYLSQHDKEEILSTNWQRWLEDLRTFSCEGFNWKNFPPTLLIHGDKDAVVWHEQSERFARLIPSATLEIWPGCGHAPHWHDSKKLYELIKTHV